MVLRRHQPVTATIPSTIQDSFGASEILRRIRGTVRETSASGGRQVEFQALGTVCRLTLVGPSAAVAAFVESALAWVAGFEAKYSRFLPGSLVSRINEAAGVDWVDLDPEAERIIAICHELNFLSRGVLDPTVLPLLRLWNWKAGVIPSEEAIRQAMECVGWRRVQRASGRIFLPVTGMGLDLGGMGKEFAVDQVALLARHGGLTGALVDFGADIRVVGLPADGRPGWHVGLEDPAAPGRTWRGLAVREAAVATSGDYHRRFEINGVRYSHILDPRTGRPTNNGVRAVSVLAPSCLQAGLLSTSALVLGPVEGLRLIDSTPGAAGAIVTETQVLQSRHFHEHVAS
ncbi:MAG TPA: FAD:protein FMN transferase [Verrucomicrobiota bacterium]|nr:FAD:protein FMN transferase [Verrucomicrobiales bacterium]HRI12518.1 FAD:protein FMN transferase [Verrucomicrobiota bacterium]